MTRIGPVCRIEFSTRRAGRKINWLQSRRLTPGAALALTTAEDRFQSTCLIATVVQRPYLEGLDKTPPEIDIMWADASQAVLDPGQELVMLEARTGYFESVRHALVGLQMAARNRHVSQSSGLPDSTY
jgi:helicase required for RNAi-mediated heterochromatin assembly 1